MLEPITWIILGFIALGLVACIFDGSSFEIPRSPRVGR